MRLCSAWRAQRLLIRKSQQRPQKELTAQCQPCFLVDFAAVSLCRGFPLRLFQKAVGTPARKPRFPLLHRYQSPDPQPGLKLSLFGWKLGLSSWSEQKASLVKGPPRPFSACTLGGSASPSVAPVGQSRCLCTRFHSLPVPSLPARSPASVDIHPPPRTPSKTTPPRICRSFSPIRTCPPS